MAPLFSKVDSNKLWHDVQNDVPLICAKSGKDLFNISKVIGLKTKWPRFLAYPVSLSARGVPVCMRCTLIYPADSGRGQSGLS